MKKELLLCVIALFAFGSFAEQGDCENVQGRLQLQGRINDLIATYPVFLDDHKGIVDRRFHDESADFQDMLDTIVNGYDFHKASSVPEEVHIEHCSESFRERINWIYATQKEMKANCARSFPNADDLQPMKQKIIKLRMAVEKLNAFCNTGLSDGSLIECLEGLENSFEQISSDSRPIQTRLTVAKYKAGGYMACIASTLGIVETEKNKTKNIASECIENAVQTWKAEGKA